jgi:hypothetical protein
MRMAFIVLGLTGAVVTLVAQPEAAVGEQRERELALVQHLHRHVLDPGDGLALAADRRDLQRMRVGAIAIGAAPPTLGAPVTDVALLETLAVVADVWHIRLNDRVPFGLMPRDRLSQLTRAQDAIGQLQSRQSRSDRDRFLPEILIELLALSRLAAGQGEVSDQAIDMALRVADQAATGRLLLGPGPYPVMPPAGVGYPPPGERYPIDAADAPPGQDSTPIPPGAVPPAPPVPPSGGPAPYELPAGYAGYTPAAQSAMASTAACQTLRNAASASSSATDMQRSAECWSRQATWPGWALQVHESLDWALTYARLDRDCAGIDAASDKLRELGGRLGIAGVTMEINQLAERAETDRRWLRGQNLCR